MEHAEMIQAEELKADQEASKTKSKPRQCSRMKPSHRIWRRILKLSRAGQTAS